MLSVQRGGEVHTLKRTGMALGAVAGKTWERERTRLLPGDLLVLYSDGITDARNEEDALFGQERLLELIRANAGRPAGEVRDEVLRGVRDFAGGVGQFDDVTPMVVRRDGEEPVGESSSSGV